MSRLIRDPLLHFLLGGVLLFVLYGFVGEGSEPPDRIVVGGPEVERLATTFARTWMRPPTRSELDGLIDDFITEEILYRQALEIGLDQNDLVIRRRLRQKMEFLAQDLARSEANDDELREFLAAHAETFLKPDLWSFQQVFLDPTKEPQAEARAARLLERLRANEVPDPRQVGDATLLPSALEQAAPREIAGTFGEGFAAALAELSEGEWGGPIASSYGIHLVLISELVPGRLPELDEIRPVVEREWAAGLRREKNEEFVRALRERYEVEVRLPSDAALTEPAP